MIWPIFIPSKNRSKTQKTGEILKQAGIKYKFVVEKNDANEYSRISDIIVLDSENMGIAFARQSILNHARKNKIKWIWMLDDDITGFYASNGKRNSKISPKDALFQAQMILSGIPNLAQGALEYQQYAWSAKHQIRFNGYCDVAVCINTEKTKDCFYRNEVCLKEDRDFTLQALSMGFMTARAAQISFSAPANGSNIGGLHEEYKKNGKEIAASKKMEELWGPEICRAYKKQDGRNDVKINWGFFKKQLN
jgi:glycosyltransferase involved in cell wall biosynthesis